MSNQEIIEAKLRHFTGTQQWYRHSLSGLLYTEGIQYLAERAHCHWLIDVVGSYQPRLDAKFQVWKVKVEEDKSALVTMVEGDGEPERVRQELPFTDFPLPEFEFFCIDGVMLLKSEY